MIVLIELHPFIPLSVTWLYYKVTAVSSNFNWKFHLGKPRHVFKWGACTDRHLCSDFHGGWTWFWMAVSTVGPPFCCWLREYFFLFRIAINYANYIVGFVFSLGINRLSDCRILRVLVGYIYRGFSDKKNCPSWMAIGWSPYKSRTYLSC